ncbi:DUF2163 domain-containing protein [Oceanicella actignis]|uniref:Bacteriophage phiJL001 Gp84 C-terminal domain-containing protein n=1 Tax=Oceanicella actignis TaxID=1189325 RepID=A0A1M7U1K9_9RHOB|nr:DUF2163 domain-containing protein [Oceanicella actignis]SES76839.1 phage conserved hypothetical protein BR0599 [Oceanicella actignis]SHN76885.1 phage conserved hypothetical protein BR0599 [Oceanicella actignis]
MTTPPESYLAGLATGATTRARCWRVTRRDGAVLGFTDHDRPLTFGGVDYEPGAALVASDAAATLGLSADDQEIAGALSSDAITESDLLRGLYDGAEVSVFDVDWTDPAARATLAEYVMGEVERTDATFRGELRSRASALDTKAGRHITNLCDASLGDGRCGVDVTGAPFMRTGVVASAAGLTIEAAEIQDAEAGFFDRGALIWTGGANAGASSVVRLHSRGAGAGVLHLWRAPPYAPQVGDTFEVRAGCPKSWDSCVVKFSNGANFRGFPHVPSEQFAVAFAEPGAAGQDGETGNPQPAPPPQVYGETMQ